MIHRTFSSTRRTGFLMTLVAAAAIGFGWQTARSDSGPSTQPTTQPMSNQQKIDAQLKALPAAGGGQDLPPLDNTESWQKGAIEPKVQQPNLLREGTWITDRTGRLTHTADDKTEFTFDSDGQAMQDPPLIVLPNLKLMQMEDAVRSANKDLRFRITGVVTEYHGRNYILLDKVLRIPDSTQTIP